MQALPRLGVSPPTVILGTPPTSADRPEPITAPPELDRAPDVELPLSVDTPRWEEREPHPWRRCFARIVDTSLNGSFLAFLLLAQFDPADRDLFFTALGDFNPVADAILTFLIAIPGNAVMIGLTGGSVGKWLFGVRILDPAGQTIGIGRALRREVYVWVRGLGLGIPIIALITVIVAFRHLTSTGVTSWDREMGIVVVHRPRGRFQVFLTGIGIVGIIALSVVLIVFPLENVLEADRK
jgi:uncharacterized RDD family membrane protein YckC